MSSNVPILNFFRILFIGTVKLVEWIGQLHMVDILPFSFMGIQNEFANHVSDSDSRIAGLRL